MCHASLYSENTDWSSVSLFNMSTWWTAGTKHSRDIDNNKCFSAILLAAQVHLWAQTVCTLKLCYHKAKAMGWSAEIIQTGEFKSAAKATMFKSEVDVNFPKHFGWFFFIAKLAAPQRVISIHELLAINPWSRLGTPEHSHPPQLSISCPLVYLGRQATLNSSWPDNPEEKDRDKGQKRWMRDGYLSGIFLIR